MSNINVNRSLTDKFYRYKMPKLLVKVEGKGSGIKTVVLNMVEVAKALNRPPTYPTKYFGCELGVQTQFDLKNKRYIVNGSHEAAKLQDLLDGFIKLYVLCPSCENPETVLSVVPKKGVINTKCIACKYTGQLDSTHKLTTFILKNPPEQTLHFDSLNTSEHKEVQFLWNADLKVNQIPVENEAMEISLDLPSVDSVELLAEKLLNRDSFDLKFILESELIKILQSLIRHQKNNNQNDFNEDVYNLFNIIFSASFNDALLMKHLKLLNIEDILVVIDILLKYLKHSINVPCDVLEKPSDLQIVNWICLVVSSHTETLLFTQDKTAKKLLKDLKKTLSIKMEEFEDLEGLQSYLSILQKKDILPQQCSFEKYSLETLDV